MEEHLAFQLWMNIRPSDTNSENESVRVVYALKWRIQRHFWLTYHPLTSLKTRQTECEIWIWDFQNCNSSLTQFCKKSLATGGWSQLDLFLNLSGEPLQRSLFDYFCPMGGGPVEIKPVRDNSKDLPGTEPKYPQRLKRYIFDGLGAGSDRDKEKKPDPGESLLSGWFLEELKRTGQRYRDIAFAPEKGDEVMVRIQTEMSSQ
jgi:hypothetical protein